MLPRMSPSPRVGRTPVSTGTSKRKTAGLGDRFIPSRRNMNVEVCRRSLFSNETNQTESRDDSPTSEQSKLFKKTLFSSLCDYPIESLDDNAKPKSLFRGSRNDESQPGTQTTRVRLEDPYSQNILQGNATLSRLGNNISSRQTASRKVGSTKPFRILTAPGLVDDYYMDHLDWSDSNTVAIALGNSVYIYDFAAAEATELANYEDSSNTIASVSFCNANGIANSRYLAIGTHHNTELWDTQSGQKVRTLHGHAGKVPSLSWKEHILTTGGVDSTILHHDIRCQNSVVARCLAHREQIVKLKWSEDDFFLASGGNDDMLCIWDLRMSSGRNSVLEPRLRLREHKSAVKAIDWNPRGRGLLASGGGTNDRTIKIWNSNTGAVVSSTDVGAQVSSIFWSKHRNELCSSHGFSSEGINANVLSLWKFGQDYKLSKMTDLTGHTSRILSTALSPDGSKIVTAGGDEIVSFYDVFGEPVKKRSSASAWGEVSLGAGIR